MFNFIDDIRQLWNQLFPTGRAYRTPYGSFKEKLRNGISSSLKQTADDSYSVLYSILPDNDNFTEEMATRWEGLLGLITNPDVPLEDRKQAIIRKMNHPGNILARQSRDYIESQLQLAGFDVYVYENIPAQTPQDVLDLQLGFTQMGDDDSEMGITEMGSAETYYPELFVSSEMGEIEMGGYEMGGFQYTNIIANHIEEEKDMFFNTGQNLRCTFFVGGNPLGTFADVDINRKDEFRQLILKLKPAQTVGFLFINYV